MSAPLAAISSMATARFLADAVDLWRQRGGSDVQLVSVGGVDAARRLYNGERFDVVVLAADPIDKLEAAGRLVAGSRVDLVRSGVSIAVQRGASRPDIRTEASLRLALLAARAVGYSTGPSGAALKEIFARWAIADSLVQAPPGVPVGALVARGEVDIGFQQLSELMHVEGIDVVGPMPPGLEIVTVFSGAVCAASAKPDAARALLGFLRSPAADDARRHHGLHGA